MTEWIRLSAQRLGDRKDELNELDAAIGDGDHGANMSRGFDAAVERLADSEDPGEVLRTVGMTLMSTVGGTAGPLYGSFYRALAEPLAGQAEIEPTAFAEALRAGVAKVQQLGKAEPEDKTMVDALLPAQQALSEAAGGGAGLGDALTAAARAAEQGAEATVPLIARKGRASYLGERSKGHRDPGATSSALLLEAAADTLAG